MDIIITGRVFNKNKLVGYRSWVVEGVNLKPLYINKNNLSIIFKKYNVLNCSYTSNKSVTSKIHIPIIEYPKYDLKGKLSIKHKYTDSTIIAVTLNVSIDSIRYLVCGALISGGIVDIYSERARRHADLYYEEIRHMTTDVEKIAKRTGYSEKEIMGIKQYLFMDYHDLLSGSKRFDSSIEIAQTWQRLMSENMTIQKHDLTLLQHELLEISLVLEGLTQNQAHIIASENYNYEKESIEYYDKIRKHKTKR